MSEDIDALFARLENSTPAPANTHQYHPLIAKSGVSVDEREVRELNAELQAARDELANMRRGVIPQGTQTQATQPAPTPAPAPAPEQKTPLQQNIIAEIQNIQPAVKNADVARAIQWIKDNPNDPIVMERINKLRKSGWIK